MMAELYRFSYRITHAGDDDPEVSVSPISSTDELVRNVSAEHVAKRFPWLREVFNAPEPGIQMDMIFGLTHIRIVDSQYTL